nr:nitroreductase family protein [Dialister invisus]
MDAIECLVTRRSIRNYTKEPVSAGDIENVVEIAQMVSCWENTQPVRYVAVLDNDLKNRIADECTKKFPWNTENIHEAPALIVLCTVKGLSGYEPNGEASTTKGTHWQSFDAGMAADHFCLAARAVDLGTLIMGRYDEEKIKEILDLPEEYDVSCIIAVGHPEVIPAANERKRKGFFVVWRMVLWTQSNAWLQGEVSAIIRKSLFPQGTSKMWWKSRRWFPAGKIRSLSAMWRCWTMI